MTNIPSLPLLRVTRVLHVGTLCPSDRGRQFRESFEGRCLSVSRHPEAWRSIARLGDAPTWQLRRNDAMTGVFLDTRAAAASPDHLATLAAWAVPAQLAEPKTLWRCWRQDLEDDSWVYSLHTSRDDAINELEDPEAHGPDGRPCVEESQVLAGTEALSERVGVALGARDATDFLFMAWVDDTRPDIDGLWWNDEYAPAALSAPRGALLPSRLFRWSKAPMTASH